MSKSFYQCHCHQWASSLSANQPETCMGGVKREVSNIRKHILPKSLDSNTAMDFYTLDGDFDSNGVIDDGFFAAIKLCEGVSSQAFADQVARHMRLTESRYADQSNSSGALDLTKQECIDYFARERRSQQHGLAIVIVGGPALAAIFLIQSCAIAMTERREENRRLRRLGVPRGSVVSAGIWEVVLDVFSATVLEGVGLSVIFAELAMQYAREGISPWRVPISVGTFVA
jgi:hypothetical protein